MQVMRLYDKSVLYWRSPPDSDLPPEVPWNLIPVRPRRRVQLQPGDVATRYTGGGGRRRIEPKARETQRQRDIERHQHKRHRRWRRQAERERETTQFVDVPQVARESIIQNKKRPYTYTIHTSTSRAGTGNLHERQEVRLHLRLTNLVDPRWWRAFVCRRVKI